MGTSSVHQPLTERGPVPALSGRAWHRRGGPAEGTEGALDLELGSGSPLLGERAPERDLAWERAWRGRGRRAGMASPGAGVWGTAPDLPGDRWSRAKRRQGWQSCVSSPRSGYPECVRPLRGSGVRWRKALATPRVPRTLASRGSL